MNRLASLLLIGPAFVPFLRREDTALPGPTASEILAEVVRRQGSDRLPESITDCQGKFDVILRKDQKRLEAKLEETYQTDGAVDRLWTSYTDAQTSERTIRGFDGKLAWSRRGNEPPVKLEGRDFERDRKEIKDDIATLKLVLKIFSLRSGESTGSSVKWVRLADTQADGAPAFILERQESGERPVKLSVDVSDYRLLAVELPPTDSDPRKQNFRLYGTLASVTVAKATVSGLSLPRQVKLFVDDAKKEESDIWIQSLSVNTGVSADLFRFPR